MLPHSGRRRTFLEVSTKQQPPAGEEPTHKEDAVTNFEPSLVVVIGVLSIVFSLTIAIILYFKRWRNSAVATSGELQRSSVFLSPAASANPVHGLDAMAIRSLPFFRFGVLRGSKKGLECAVCLCKYEDTEILRLLPKCRHAFHVDCVDGWLSHQSTCPLCRSDVVAHDATPLNSISFCASSGQGEVDDSSFSSNANPISTENDSSVSEGLDLFVEREEQETEKDKALHRSSSIFSIRSSFKRLFSGEDRISITGDSILHKHNHKIVVSDVMFKNRWSNVSSSDLKFLSSELMRSSNRFSDAGCITDKSAMEGAAEAVVESEGAQSVKGETEKKRRREWIPIELAKRNSNASSSSPSRALLIQSGGVGGGDSLLVEGRRSVSEITMYSRSKELGWRSYRAGGVPAEGGGDSSGGREEEEGEKKRKIWFPIARKTVEWFARREETEKTTNQRDPKTSTETS